MIIIYFYDFELKSEQTGVGRVRSSFKILLLGVISKLFYLLAVKKLSYNLNFIYE